MPMTGVVCPVTLEKVHAYLAADQLNLVDGVETKLLLALTRFDPSGLLAANKLTIVVPGYYLLTGSVAWVSGSASRNQMMDTLIKVNAATAAMAGLASVAVNTMTTGVATILHLDADDEVELYACSHAGVDTADVDSDPAGTYLAIHLLAGDDQGFDNTDIYNRLTAIEADYVTADQLEDVQDDVDDNADDIATIAGDYLKAASLAPYSTTVQVAAMIAAILAAYSTTVQMTAAIAAAANILAGDIEDLEDRIADIEGDYTTAAQAAAIAYGEAIALVEEHQDLCVNWEP